MIMTILGGIFGAGIQYGITRRSNADIFRRIKSVEDRLDCGDGRFGKIETSISETSKILAVIEYKVDQLLKKSNL